MFSPKIVFDPTFDRAASKNDSIYTWETKVLDFLLIWAITPLSTRNHHSKSVEFDQYFENLWEFGSNTTDVGQIPQILSVDFGWRVVLFWKVEA